MAEILNRPAIDLNRSKAKIDMAPCQPVADNKDLLNEVQYKKGTIVPPR